MTAYSRLIGGIAAAVLALYAPAAFGAPTEEEPKKGPGTTRDEECLVCHAGVGEEEAPKLDMPLYNRAAHAEEGCVGCHPDVEDESIEHELEDQDLAPAVCVDCHQTPREDYEDSRHADAEAAKKADKDQATCAACHGMHDILPAEDPASRVHPIRQLETCGQCHGLHRTAAAHAFDIPEEHKATVEAGDPETIKALLEAGELVKASCTDCHSFHEVKPSTEVGSSLHPANAPQTCGRCHEDATKAFDRSIHADASRKDGFEWDTSDAANAMSDPDQPPTCITCHRMHDGAPPKTDEFRLDLVQECGTCHKDLMVSYVESYHGKATALGDASVAKCSDCHGFHEIRAIDDPMSMASAEKKLETCQSCHEGAPENFAGFWAHADPHDADKYPLLFWVYTFMTTLLVSVFAFFGLHTLLWAIREGVDAMKEGALLPKKAHDGPRVSRFSPMDRLVHLLVIISFLGLALTGAPLKFATASWAQPVFALLGGVEGAGILHRIFAVVTFVYFALHLGSMARKLMAFNKEGVLPRKLLGPDSLVPQLQDLRDIFGSFRWFFGLAPQPKWDKWTYWEKFDYWAVFWGVAIIGSSGLVLWFPAFFTQVIPGYLVNVALVVHSDEALLAMGFIFGVHFFNGHLRRAKFPMDEVMFTGSVPAGEYKEEREREWARMVADGSVDKRRAAEPSAMFRLFARIFGIAAWLTGLIILGLIVHGFLTT